MLYILTEEQTGLVVACKDAAKLVTLAHQNEAMYAERGFISWDVSLDGCSLVGKAGLHYYKISPLEVVEE